LLEQSIQSHGIDVLTPKVKFSLFDPSFLAELKKTKEKNLALKLLENLLRDSNNNQWERQDP